MTKSDSIVDEALRLPRESRALLAEKLLESLDYEEDFALSPAWLDEVKRRCREIDEGKAVLTPSERVFEDLDTSLG